MSGRRVTANVLCAFGTALLIIPAVHVATGLRAQSDGATAFAEVRLPALPRGKGAALSSTSAFSSLSAQARPETPAAGQAWGRIEIPRVGLDWVVYEGVRPGDLRKGPGHVPETAAPDSPDGNCVIAGHRDSFFRALSRARKGDVVLVRGRDGATASYRLESRRVVSPNEVSVMAPTRDRRLTLITCYPFGWIGPAPYRLVWNAVAAGATASASAELPESGTPARSATLR